MVEQVPQQVAEQSSQKSNRVLIFSGLVVFLLLIAGVVGLWFWDSSRLVVQDQSLDGLLIVEKAVLTQPGYVAVYNTNSLGERGSFVLGQSALLEAGTYKNFTVDINAKATNQTGEIILKSGDKVIFDIQNQTTGQNASSNFATRGIFGQEIRKTVTLN